MNRRIEHIEDCADVGRLFSELTLGTTALKVHPKRNEP
jgi:hypothetical protein